MAQILMGKKVCKPPELIFSSIVRYTLKISLNLR
jgi:hypothetical protein